MRELIFFSYLIFLQVIIKKYIHTES